MNHESALGLKRDRVYESDFVDILVARALLCPGSLSKRASLPAGRMRSSH